MPNKKMKKLLIQIACGSVIAAGILAANMTAMAAVEDTVVVNNTSHKVEDNVKVTLKTKDGSVQRDGTTDAEGKLTLPILVVSIEKPTGPNKIFSTGHTAYINGYDGNLVKPNANITRAEVATIFYRLLDDNVRAKFETEDNNFSDVNGTDWYNTAVSTIANTGTIDGYNDGTFKPNNTITRAEFAAIASRFDSTIGTVDMFKDIAQHWAKTEIERAAYKGWVTGYEDDTFRPENMITRAEAITVINRVTGRMNEANSELIDEMIRWNDNATASAWYYTAIQEATNSHDYTIEQDGTERWTGLDRKENKEVSSDEASLLFTGFMWKNCERK